MKFSITLENLLSILESGSKEETPEKNPWQLAPWDALVCIVKVLAFGVPKYGARNWEKGIQYGKIYRAAIEHLTKWWMRVDGGIDPESGYSHLWHAGCNVMFLIAYEIRGMTHLDDRP